MRVVFHDHLRVDQLPKKWHKVPPGMRVVDKLGSMGTIVAIPHMSKVRVKSLESHRNTTRGFSCHMKNEMHSHTVEKTPMGVMSGFD